MDQSKSYSRPWTKPLIAAGVFVLLAGSFYSLQHYNTAQIGLGIPSTPDNEAHDTFPPPNHEAPHTHAGLSWNGSHTSDLATKPSTVAKTKAVVASVTKDDETTADWLVEFLPDWEAVVYVADRNISEKASPNSSPITPHFLPTNRGREAAVYLTYLIQHYNNLPDYMVFIHGKRYQSHNGESWS
jgi:hypothetical protein